ncbi:MAG: rhodanese-like domain-containing protein [Phycisphaeraceae bacterium]|nr:rhodanese-like domain-containing protein [Phycisphaeraceae bacterium]
MKLARTILILLALPVGPAVITAFAHPHSPWGVDPRDPALIMLKDALAIPNVLWLDARPTLAHEEKHMPDAMALNEDDWDDQIEDVMLTWQPDQVVIVYCDETLCQSGLQVGRRLHEETGIEPVRVLEGGWDAWLKHEQEQ